MSLAAVILAVLAGFLAVLCLAKPEADGRIHGLVELLLAVAVLLLGWGHW